MVRRRGNGEGFVGKLKDGRWQARATKGFNASGNQQFKYFSSKTRQGALQKLNEFLEQKRKGTFVEAESWSLGDWLDYWYKHYVVGKTRTSTRVNDESIIKHHIKPALGRVKLKDLRGINIQPFYNQLLIDGRVDKKGGLSAKTIKNIHVVLHRALEQAMKNELIMRNPLYSVSLPRAVKKEIQILSPEEQKRLLEVCCKGEDPFYMAILLTLYSGLRMGELLGLTWDNVDFNNNRISIKKQASRLKDYSVGAKNKTKLFLRDETKSNCSERRIAIAKVIMERLKEHQNYQSRFCKRLGEGFNQYNLVFIGATGGIVDPATFRDFYLRALKQANITSKTFHALRHTFATRALESNVNIKVVSEILGHATIQITLDTYSHVSYEEQEKAMEKVAEMFF